MAVSLWSIPAPALTCVRSGRGWRSLRRIEAHDGPRSPIARSLHRKFRLSERPPGGVASNSRRSGAFDRRVHRRMNSGLHSPQIAALVCLKWGSAVGLDGWLRAISRPCRVRVPESSLWVQTFACHQHSAWREASPHLTRRLLQAVPLASA